MKACRLDGVACLHVSLSARLSGTSGIGRGVGWVMGTAVLLAMAHRRYWAIGCI